MSNFLRNKLSPQFGIRVQNRHTIVSAKNLGTQNISANTPTTLIFGSQQLDAEGLLNLSNGILLVPQNMKNSTICISVNLFTAQNSLLSLQTSMDGISWTTHTVSEGNLSAFILAQENMRIRCQVNSPSGFTVSSFARFSSFIMHRNLFLERSNSVFSLVVQGDQLISTGLSMVLSSDYLEEI